MKKKLITLAIGIASLFGAYGLALPLWAYLPGVALVLFSLAWMGVYDADADRKGLQKWSDDTRSSGGDGANV